MLQVLTNQLAQHTDDSNPETLADEKSNTLAASTQELVAAGLGSPASTTPQTSQECPAETDCYTSEFADTFRYADALETQ
jgi:hypothetical protein